MVTVCAILGLLNAIIAVLGGVTRAQFEQSQLDLPPDVIDDLIAANEVGTIILSTTSSFLWWIAIYFLVQLTTRFFGGSGPFSTTLAVMGVSFVPLALGGISTGSLPQPRWCSIRGAQPRLPSGIWAYSWDMPSPSGTRSWW